MRELLQRVITGDDDGDFFLSHGLYKEIQELLAQPEQNNTQYLLDQVARLTAENAMLKEKWQEPEQDPVAWHYIYDDGITVRERVTECMPLGKHYTVTPLYTSPPKREPLSDKEIHAYLSLMEPPFLWDEGFCSGIEWAEKQHGIGVDDE